MINISNETLVNFWYKFSSNNILNAKINFTDGNTTKFNMKNLYSYKETIIYKVHKKGKFIRINNGNT